MTDAFSQLVEQVAASIGLTVTCRRVHREAIEVCGETFPAFDEYEVRCGRRLWWFDIGMAEVGILHAVEHIRGELTKERTER